MANTAWSQAMVNLMGGGVIGAAPAVGVTTQALNSAYTYASAGTAVSNAFLAPYTGNLTDFSFYVPTVQGTGGNVSWEIRSLTNGNNVPGTTQVATGSFGAVSTTGYKNVSGLSVPLTQGTLYWLTLYDASTGGTNYCFVRVSNGQLPGKGAFFTQGYQTSNGFSTGATNTQASGAFAFKQNGVWYGGSYLDTSSTTTSGSFARGTRFNLPVSMTLAGFVDTFGSAGVTTGGNVVTLWNDSNSSLWTFTYPTLAGGNPLPAAVPYLLDSGNWYDLSASTWYMLTVTPTGAQTTPRKATGPASVPNGWMLAGMPFGGQCHYVENNGSWDKSQTQSMCNFGPYLVPGGPSQICYGSAG